MYFCIKMDASFTMEIPKKFVTNFKRQLCENVELKGPSGSIWHVKMLKSNNDCIYQSGWRDFVIANKIGKNDILVFKYSAKYCSFEVMIFDPSGCEKAAPFFAKKTETEMYSQESSDTSVQVVAEHRCEVNKQDFIYITSSNEISNEISSDDGRLRVSRKRVVHERGASNGDQVDSEAIPQKRKRGSQTRIPKSGTPDKSNALVKSLYVVPRSVHLTSFQEEIALGMSHTAKPGNPIFIRPLVPSNVAIEKTCQINFPSGFAPSLKELGSQRLILRRHGEDKEWHARYFSSYPGGICGVGLRDFVLENNLKKGDLCLFELMKNEPKLTMTVHVFSM